MKKIERHTLVEINFNKYDLICYNSKNHILTKYNDTRYSIDINRTIDKLYIFTYLEDGDFIFNSYFFNKNRVVAGFNFLDSGFFLLKEASKYYKLKECYEAHNNKHKLVVDIFYEKIHQRI